MYTKLGLASMIIDQLDLWYGLKTNNIFYTCICSFMGMFPYVYFFYVYIAPYKSFNIYILQFVYLFMFFIHMSPLYAYTFKCILLYIYVSPYVLCSRY